MTAGEVRAHIKFEIKVSLLHINFQYDFNRRTATQAKANVDMFVVM